MKPILMHLSNFRPVKRVVDVVKVFARVAQERPAQLVLVGDGPDRSAAEWLAHDLGIQSRVHFLGKQERVNELLPLADLMLMPSELESFGLAALEAMACKVPAIATRVGGVPELIDDGVTGLLFAVGDVEGMAAGALGLAEGSGTAGGDARRGAEGGAEAVLRDAGGAAVCAVLRAGACGAELSRKLSLIGRKLRQNPIAKRHRKQHILSPRRLKVTMRKTVWLMLLWAPILAGGQAPAGQL